MYKNWLLSGNIKKELKETEGYTFYIDKILFSLGKAVKYKAKKSKKKSP